MKGLKAAYERGNTFLVLGDNIRIGIRGNT